MALMELCRRCGTKIPYRAKYCDECKTKEDADRAIELKAKSKKYNSDRYLKDKQNESYRLFYTTQVWKNKRQEILRRDECHCMICKALCKHEVATDVHHVLNLLDHYDKRLDNDNLISLCSQCHKDVHALGLNSKDKLNKYINQKIKSDKFIKELLKSKF